MKEKIEQLRARATALRENAAQAPDGQNREELLLAARECEKLAVELELEGRGQPAHERALLQRFREPQKLH